MNNLQEITRLKEEIADLNDRLQASNREKAQAGELGLHLLKEKEQLELALEALSREYDSLRTELERTQKALVTSRGNSLKTNSEYDPDVIYDDSQKIEAHFISKIDTLENEIKSLNEKIYQYKTESERYQSEQTSNQERIELLESERRSLKDELKTVKKREQSLLNENNELEEENISLQKQISNLKSSQVEFESMKREINRLLEEMVFLQASADEANKLRLIAEGHEEEALAAAHQEREQRLALKKELEKLKNVEHLASLNNIFNDISVSDDPQNEATKQLESFLLNGEGMPSFHKSNLGQHETDSRGSDLFSDLSSSFQSQIIELQSENEKLRFDLQNSNRTFAQAIAPFLIKLGISENFENYDLSKLKECMEIATKRLNELKTKDSEKLDELLKSDLHQIILLAGQNYARLCSSQNKIIQLCHTIHQIYRNIGSTNPEFESNRIKSNTIMENLKKLSDEFDKENQISRVESPSIASETPIAESLDPNEWDTKSPVDISSRNTPLVQSFSLRFLDKLRPQLKFAPFTAEINELNMKNFSVEDDDEIYKVIDSAKELLTIFVSEANVSTKVANDKTDRTELYQHIAKLESRLTAKKEQAIALRNVLRLNKNSAEGAIQSLREQCESEKKAKDEVLEQLRRELKHCKEDAATFASHRAMFTARCEELEEQLESAIAAKNAADQEKKTLNDLLQIAIRQKLALNQQVEQFELEREQQIHHGMNKRPLRNNTSSAHHYPHPNHNQYHHNIQQPSSHHFQQRESTRAVRYPGSSSSSGVPSSGITPGGVNYGSGGGGNANANRRNKK